MTALVSPSLTPVYVGKVCIQGVHTQSTLNGCMKKSDCKYAVSYLHTCRPPKELSLLGDYYDYNDQHSVSPTCSEPCTVQLEIIGIRMSIT